MSAPLSRLGSAFGADVATAVAWYARCMGKDSDRARRLWKLYGLTLEDYQALLVSQGGACAICQAVPKPGTNLAVDHDHAIVAKVKKAARTPELMRTSVRGLLCWLCNHRRIGRGATPAIMLSAASYLSDSLVKAQRTLCDRTSA